MKISFLFLEGRGLPFVRLLEEEEERREVSVDVKARLVEEDSSLGVFLGLWWGYRWASVGIFPRT